MDFIKKRYFVLSMGMLLIQQNLHARQVVNVGENTVSFRQNVEQAASFGKSIEKLKTIKLLKVKMDEAEKTYLNQAIKYSSINLNQDSPSTFPSKKFLGMNNVPVLDQGMHGTCVTFAATAAIDAHLDKGDYISQLCNLTLGSYLENNKKGLSGWNGSNINNVLKQIEQYGIVSKQNQRKYRCGGFKEYPRYLPIDPHTTYTTPEQFLPMSEKIYESNLNWRFVFHENGEETLNEVKKAINAGHRLSTEFLVPATDLGVVGAVGKHKNWFDEDTWVLSSSIKKYLNDVHSGHEVVITGYDDNAIAKDDKGKKHKGLLKLRNSWGYWAGYWGEFYMSYDYFKLLTYNLVVIE